MTSLLDRRTVLRLAGASAGTAALAGSAAALTEAGAAGAATGTAWSR